MKIALVIGVSEESIYFRPHDCLQDVNVIDTKIMYIY